MPRTRRDWVYFVLGGFFLTNAIVAELTGGKLFSVPAWGLSWLSLESVVLSIGVLPWPIVFVSTDLVNEYFGKAGVRRLTFLAVGMILYTFGVLSLAIQVPAWEKSPVTDLHFASVFGQSNWIIVGSVTAFLIAQLLDVFVFLAVRRWTGKRLLWLRATGSTALSQIADTFIVGYIAFVLPPILGLGKGLTFGEFIPLAIGNYAYKLLIAVLITPVIYLAHAIIDGYLQAESEPGLSPEPTCRLETLD